MRSLINHFKGILKSLVANVCKSGLHINHQEYVKNAPTTISDIIKTDSNIINSHNHNLNSSSDFKFKILYSRALIKDIYDLFKSKIILFMRIDDDFLTHLSRFKQSSDNNNDFSQCLSRFKQSSNTYNYFFSQRPHFELSVDKSERFCRLVHNDVECANFINEYRTDFWVPNASLGELLANNLLQKSIADINNKSSNFKLTYEKYICDLSLATGIHPDKISSFVKCQKNYNAIFTFDMYYSYFKKIGIDEYSIMKFQYITQIEILKIFHFIYKEIEAFNELKTIRTKTNANIKAIITKSIKKPATDPIPCNDNILIPLILYFKPSRENALAYYTLSKKSVPDLLESAENPDKKLKSDNIKFTTVKMHSIALLAPDYFESLEEWQDAFWYCINYLNDNSTEISNHYQQLKNPI